MCAVDTWVAGKYGSGTIVMIVIVVIIYHKYYLL